MNSKLLIGFLVVLAAVLLLPLVAGYWSATPSAPAPAPAAQEPVPPPPEEQPVPEEQYQQPPPPFQFTAQTLTGTAWEVATPQGPVSVELLPGGRAVFRHPMVGAVEGNWRVNGTVVTVTASPFGQKYTISCNIQGDTLVYQGMPIRRLR